MALKEVLVMMVKSLCVAVTHAALRSTGVHPEYEQPVVHVEPEPAVQSAPPPNQDLTPEESTDFQEWWKEQELLRELRPNSPLIDPDFDHMRNELIMPMEQRLI